jgi:hypothetical protein
MQRQRFSTIPCLLNILSSMAAAASRADEPEPLAGSGQTISVVKIDVLQADLSIFVSGEGVYPRLPSILVTVDGTVLAACQKRKGSRSVWAASALVLKRSTDGGRSARSNHTRALRIIASSRAPPGSVFT